MDYTFELTKAYSESLRKPYFWWRLKAKNKKVISTSEPYTAKCNALRIINKLKTSLEKGGCKCGYTYINKV